MTEKKFLSDGRKVAVLGRLNNAEYIVQEIFVTESGEEIPSGENFTTKSLHDAPLESYYKKEEARQKACIEKAKNQLDQLYRQIKEKQQLLEAKADMLANSPEVKNLVGDKARIFSMFVTGTVNYLVVGGYTVTAPVKMEDKLIYWQDRWGEKSFDSIKLCSILGKSKGEMEYRIHEYSDGSGMGYTQVYPFETYQEAIEKVHSLASERINNGRLCRDEYDLCKSLGIKFTQDELDKLFAAFSQGAKESMERISKDIEKSQAEEVELQARFASLEKYVYGE